MTRSLAICGVTASFLASTAIAETIPGIGVFEGTAGLGSSNGDVSDSPVGSSYVYVSTANSEYTDAGLGVGGETNGSELTTFQFDATAGDVLSYYFNYITSDGAGFSDYAYAILNSLTDNAGDELIFTARTTTAGNTVPGFDLPEIADGVTLTPTTSAIVANATTWEELGSSSGGCFSAGCGSTGWIQSNYMIETDGAYSFTFGVTNISDQIFASGLAIAGLTVGDQVIIPDDPGGPISPPPSAVPLPAGAWMLLAALGGLGLARRRD